MDKTGNEISNFTNDLVILRQAALELHRDEPDLVRVAGIVQRIRNWWKARFDTDFMNRQNELQGKYEALKPSMSELITNLNALENGFKDQDPDAVAQLVGPIRSILPRVMSEISKFNKSIKDTDNAVPSETVTPKPQQEAEKGGKFIRTVTREQANDPEVLKQLISQLDKNFDVPIRDGIYKKLTDFNWYKSYKKIEISTDVKRNIWDRVETALLNSPLASNISREDAVEILNYGFSTMIENLEKSILNFGIINSCAPAFPSENSSVKNRPANEMRLDINAGAVALPSSKYSIYIEFPHVILIDLGTAEKKIKALSMAAVNNIRVSTHSDFRIRETPVTTEASAAEPVADQATTVADQATTVNASVNPDNILVKLVKRHLIASSLPKTRVLIKSTNEVPREYLVRYMKVLGSALREELDAESSVHDGGSQLVEVESDIYGSDIAVKDAAYGIASGVSDAFEKAFGYGIKVAIDIGTSSEHGLISSAVLDESFRKLAFESWSRNV
jgi:hypothetical protein